MQDLWSSQSSAELPPLSDLIEEARRQRSGPPLDPRAAAYSHVALLARNMLWRETLKDRRKEVLKEFDRRVARLEKSFEGHDSFGSQLAAVERSLVHADFFGLDLRGHRESKGPDDKTLLSEYEALLPIVKQIFRRRPRGERTGTGRAHVRSNSEFLEWMRSLSIEFPFLSPDQAAEAAHDKPSWGAYVILGARHGLSPSRVRDRLTAARRARRRETRR